MKVLFYDCFCGISGDMNLGAMIDLGIEPEWLVSELKKLSIADEFELTFERKKKQGIEGTKVDVVLKSEGAKAHHHHEGHDHGHKHDHGHRHDHGHKHEHTPHDHRNMTSITKIIESSDLSDRVKQLSLAMFMEIAEAEAKVHGTTVDKIHFHEVGAVDAIVDIVGAAICYEKLGVDKVVATPIQLGGGFVKCDHGMMPVPAPATAEILKGIPVKTGLVASEMTTPTGAAILKTLVNEYVEGMSMTVERIGYGLGTKEFEFPNLVRVMLLSDVQSVNSNGLKKNAK